MVKTYHHQKKDLVMKNQFELALAKATQADKVQKKEVIQELWSGYGKIFRYKTSNPEIPRVVVKHIQYPDKKNHPRGWNTDLSHKRKLRSYQVEIEWYKKWSLNCDNKCRVPKCLAVESSKNEILIVLEDLDTAGYSLRNRSVNYEEMHSCLSWLANFHATFLNQKPAGLWGIGTYWHLATRPDELATLSDQRLKLAAKSIDRALNECRFKTFVHGDAKLANFCFSPKSNEVAAVDFQYVGGGCGMKDVAYLVGSCFRDNECEKLESQILFDYFNLLKAAVKDKNLQIDFGLLENEWRRMYHIAWADFHRFLKGWSPEHWKLNTYSENVTKQVMDDLGT